MVKLMARILQSNSIAHHFDTRAILINKDDISSIYPNTFGRYTLTMKTKQVFDIDMSWEEIEKAMEE